MARTFQDYMNRAQVSLAENVAAGGFATKQARKDAHENTARAFDLVKREIHDSLLAIPDRDSFSNRDAWSKLYWGVPDCHAWKAKHGVMFAAYPDAVARANQCAALREQIKGVPERPKPLVKPRTAKQQAKDAKARTCQICGRPIFAELGVIAHHGYERPGMGWQTDSCEGARELPYEASKLVLVRHIARAHARLASMRESRADAAAEKGPIGIAYETPRLDPVTGRRAYDRQTSRGLYDRHAFEVTRATFDAMVAKHPVYFKDSVYYPALASFDGLKARDLAERDSKIEAMAGYIKMQQGRADAWTHLETWRPKGGQFDSGFWLAVPPVVTGGA